MVKIKIDWKKVLIKAVGTGIILVPLTALSGMILTAINSGGFAWMEGLVMVVATVLLGFALKYRQGIENIFEALISLGFMYGVWGIIGGLVNFNPLVALSNGGLFDSILFWILFFTAEGIVQRLTKMWKLA
jgi:hypothetical protein